MAGSVPASAFRRVRYNGTARSSIWRRLLPTATLLLALPSGACSYQLGSLMGHDSAKADKTVDKSEVTGSISSTPVAAAANDADLE